jgi:acylphosphatase
MKRRVDIIVKGEVQKVGYRDDVQRIARGLDIKGYVENLRDGSVLIVCEGENEDMDEFLEKIRIKKHFIDVKEVNVTKEGDYKGEFEYFDIKYGSLEEELGERMGTGIVYAGATWTETKAVRGDIKAMHTDLKEGFKTTREELKEGFKTTREELKEGFKTTREELKEGFNGTRKDIQAMHTDMNRNFQDLDNKYHSVSNNLESLNENLTRVVDGLVALIKEHIERDHK